MVKHEITKEEENAGRMLADQLLAAIGDHEPSPSGIVCLIGICELSVQFALVDEGGIGRPREKLEEMHRLQRTVLADLLGEG